MNLHVGMKKFPLYDRKEEIGHQKTVTFLKNGPVVEKSVVGGII